MLRVSKLLVLGCGVRGVSALAAVPLPHPHLSAAAASRVSARNLVRPLMVDAGENRKGTCKWFDSVKGYGFITVDGEELDIFVHQSDIYAPGFRSLNEGEDVEFEVMVDSKTNKYKAIKVTGPEGSYVQGQPRKFDDEY